jgi:hypothetical protein
MRLMLVLVLKGRRVFRLHFAPVIDAGGGDVGVAQPFLDFGDVGSVVKRIGGGGLALARPVLTNEDCEL